MDIAEVDSELSTTCQEAADSFIELEAQMASLLSLHSVTSDSILPDVSSMHQSAKDLFTVPDSNYVSVIKFNGQPIPPPVVCML